MGQNQWSNSHYLGRTSQKIARNHGQHQKRKRPINQDLAKLINYRNKLQNTEEVNDIKDIEELRNEFKNSQTVLKSGGGAKQITRVELTYFVRDNGHLK